MNNLWKKETDQKPSLHVDLFASVPQNQWNHQDVKMVIENLKSYDSGKNNQMATEFRVQGNDEFRAKHWLEAMQLYNRCLCYAEIGTEEVALAYSNRSACFFHMEKYDKVLADIELAKGANPPDQLLSKLEKRKHDTLKLMAKVKSSPKPVPQLSYRANPNYPCLADVVDMARNNEFGRHLIATRDIPVGKIVLLENDYVAMRTDNDLVCETCFCQATNFIACSKCCDVVFCNVECMKRNSIHKWECGSMPRSMANDLMIYYKRLKFQFRVLFLALEMSGDVKRLMEFVDTILTEDPDEMPTLLNDSQSKYRFFFKLKASPPLDEQVWEYCAVYKGIQSYPKINALFNTNRKKRFLMHLVSHHFRVSNTNSIGNYVTKSLANVLSMLNHSCHPNLATLYIRNNQCCVTIRPIKKGDQLFITYLNDAKQMSSKERQEMFKNKWNFVCKCDRCNPSTEDREYESMKSDPNFNILRSYFMDEEISQIVAECCVQLLSKYDTHPWSDEFAAVTGIYISALLKQFESM